MSLNKWNLEKFLEKANEIHGEKYDYSNIKDCDIQNNKSKVKIKCNKCNHIWYPSIVCHINEKTACPSCSGKLGITLKRFLEKAKEIHGDKYDYNNIKESDIINSKSKVKIKCKKCNYIWHPSINHFIQQKSNCICYKINKVTLSKFLEKANEIHRDKYDYSNIKECDIINIDSRITIKCNKCEYIWNTTTAASHLSNKTGCPNCSGLIRWTLKRFLEKAKEIHGDKYDYSNIKEYNINSYNEIIINCKKCNNNWNTCISNHITKQYGCPKCPKCRKSKLEQKMYNVFNDLNIKYKSEYIPKDFKLINCKFRYDACFEYNNKTYFVEMDGVQHFKNVDYFKDTLEYVQLKDRFKTQFVLKHPNNYNLIRIDYTCKTQDDIKKFIQKSIKSKNRINLYNINLYKNWLKKEITEEEYEKINNGNKYYLLLTIMDVINEIRNKGE